MPLVDQLVDHEDGDVGVVGRRILDGAALEAGDLHGTAVRRDRVAELRDPDVLVSIAGSHHDPAQQRDLADERRTRRQCGEARVGVVGDAVERLPGAQRVQVVQERDGADDAARSALREPAYQYRRGVVGGVDGGRGRLEQRRIAGRLHRAAPAEGGVLLVPDLVDDVVTAVAGGERPRERGESGDRRRRRGRPEPGVGPRRGGVDGQDQPHVVALRGAHDPVQAGPVEAALLGLDRRPGRIHPHHLGTQGVHRLPGLLRVRRVEHPGVRGHPDRQHRHGR